MIEANAEIYEARSAVLTEKSGAEGKVLLQFRTTRANLGETGTPMTNAQKSAALGKLAAVKAEREAAAMLLDETFDATEIILED